MFWFDVDEICEKGKKIEAEDKGQENLSQIEGTKEEKVSSQSYPK